MTDDSATDAVTRLAEALQRENTALAALDLAAAGRLLSDKTAALDAFAAACRSGAAPAREAAEQLRAVTLDNKRLLERAILVQGRVLGMIARAAPRAVAGAPTLYERNGAAAPGRRLPAVALSARC